MASFEDLRKEMRSKYGTSAKEKEEDKKKSSSGSTQSSTPKAGGTQGKNAFEELRDQMNFKYNRSDEVDEKYITSFVSEASRFLNSAQSDYNQLSYSTASSIYDTRKKTAEDLQKRSWAISQYLNANRDRLNAEYINSVKNYLKSFEDATSKSMYSFYNGKKYYSQWETEDDYNEYIAYQRDYEEKSKFDLEAGQKEIIHLEKVLEDYKLLTRFATDEKGAQRATQIRQQYGDESAIKALISQKKAYLNQAKHIQEGIALSGVAENADFDEYSGYASIKADDWWSRLTGDDYDETYEYINNQNGARDEIKRKHRSYSADNPFDDGESSFEEKGYDYLTENEIAIYNYHYAKDGKEKAQEYLDNIQETLNRRKATSMYEKMEDHTALELAFGVVAGIDQWESGTKNLFNTEDDYIAQTAYQMASGMVREDLADDSIPVWYNFKVGKWEDKVLGSSVGQIGYDAITTTANMAPSMLTSMAANMLVPGSGAIVGNAMMFASSAGNAYQEALNLGYDKGSARAYSALVGGSEAGLQYLLGGISSLGGKVTGNVLNKMLNGIDNAFARAALKLGGNMLSEGMEEGLQEILTPLFKNWTLRADEDINWSEVAYSGLLGALTAGAMEGGSTISGEVSTYKTGRQLQKAGISAQRLSDIGKNFADDTVAYQLAGRVNENTGAYTMGRLFNEIGATITEQNVTEITKALVTKGMDKITAKKYAETLAYVVEGGQLTDRQIAAMEADEVLAEVVRTTLIDANTTWNQRSNGYNEMLRSLADEMTSPKASGTKQGEEGKEITSASDNADGQRESGAEGISEVDTSPAKVGSITAIQNGKVTIKLEDGSEVNVADADLSPDDGVRIETIASIDGISAADANFILNALRVSPSASAQMDSLGAKEAYKYGFYGFSQEHIAKHGVFAKSLTETQRQTIYEVGQRARQRQVEKATPKKAAGKESLQSGKVHFDGDRSTLTERQSASLTAMEKIAEALGVQIHVFESQIGKNGKRIGANGWYDPKDGSIHIDLHAGANGEGTMLFTLAHELTHHIRQWSPAKFKVLADFLIQEYGKKGVNVDALVREQMAKAKRNGRAISYDTAYEEVIADSMEMMLSDGKVMEKLAKLKQKDESLWQKIKDFISELAVKIRNVYDGMSPDSVEGRHVAEMVEAIEKLQELFTEGLVDASENYQSAEKNTTEGGENLFMSRDIENVTEDTVREDLSEVFNGNNVSAKSYIPLARTTPFALRYITGYSKDLPIIVDKKKAYFDMRESGKFKEDSNHHYHGMGVDGFLNALEILNDPEYAIREETKDGGEHFAFISTNENGEEVCVAFDMAVFKPASMMNGYPGGFYNLDITEFVATDEWLEEHGVEPGMSYKDFLLSFDTNSLAYDRSIHLEQLEEARNTDVGSAGLAASHINNRASEDKVSQTERTVKNESAEALDLAVDEKTESVAPAVLFSERTWTESDYVQEREKAAKEIAKAIGVSEKKAKAYIDSVNSIAKMIAEDRVRLDYFSSPNRSSFVGNVEYGGSFDFSTLCKKRRLLTGTFTAIQKALPNTALTADEILDIRNRMKNAGLGVSCGLCYVEGSRANMGQFAKEFLKLYKQYYPDAWQPNMADVNTPDGIEWVRINHPECYEQYEYFWNHYGTLKEGDKNLFASQQKPKLYQLHTEYKGEILEKFKNDDNVEEKNLNGGIRLQSFSDFEIVHLIDTMQIIMDMSRVGLAGQAYTKVPDFAWALGDTGLKINLSLIAKGVDGNGKLIFDDVEGMPIDTAVALRNRYSRNVGTILVAFNDEQLLAAMSDERVDFIIPFHRSQWKKSQYETMGLPAKTKDYTYMQNEKFIKPQYHEYRGRMVKDKATNYMPNEYWDFSKSGKENAEAYLEMCARNNKRPKFYKLLQNNGDGSYSLKADGSTDGYWKLLVDFKMYDNDGKGSPQMPVKPDFNMDEAIRMLNDYGGGHSNFPVAQGIVDNFVKEYKDSHKGVKYSDRDSDGRQLSEDQQEFFKHSKARDKKGNLLRLYHGSNSRVTKFNPMFSDDKTSLFMTDKFDVAASYSRRYRELNPYEYIDEDSTAEDLIVAANRLFSGKKNLRVVSEHDIEAASIKATSTMPSVLEKLSNISEKLNNSNVKNTFGARGLSRNLYTAENIIGGNPSRSNYEKLLSQNIGTRPWLEVVSTSLESLLAFDSFGFVHADIETVVDEMDSIREEAALTNAKGLAGKDSAVFQYEDASGETFFEGERTLRKEINWETSGGILPVYANITNPFVVEAKGRRWNNIATPPEMRSFHDYDTTNTRTVAAYAKENGYDGVIFKGLVDMGGYSAQKSQRSTVVIAFDGTQMKSTMNKTPTTDSDIRYSGRDSDGRQLSQGQAEYFKDSQARDENGNLVTVYHSSPGAGFFEFSGNKGAGHYRFSKYGNAITYFTDSKVMADSYAPTNDRVDTTRGGRFKDGLQAMKQKLAGQSAPRYSGQYEGYTNITKPYVVDAEGRNWNMVSPVFDQNRYEAFRSITAEEKAAVNRLWELCDQDTSWFWTIADTVDVGVNKAKLSSVEMHAVKRFMQKSERWSNMKKALGDSLPLIASALKKSGGSYALVYGRENDFDADAVRNHYNHELGVKGGFFSNPEEPGYKTTNDVVFEALEAGIYDGVIIRNVVDYAGYNSPEERTPGNLYITFSPEQFKAWDNTEPTRSKDIRYSDRDIEPVSNRSLLANAFDGVAQNDIERQKIQEYKSKIDRINAEERRLHELRTQIKEMSFAKGPRDTKKIRDLQLEANQTANRISTYDKQLLRLEASLPLQNVLNREKELARKRAEQKGKEALEAYREKATKAQRELLEKWQTSRKKGIDNRRRTAMRHKIKDVVNELNRYLLNGTKDRHVPIGLQKAVAEALNAVNMDTVGAEERIAKLNEELLKAKTPEAIRDISKRIDNIREMGDRMDERLKKLKAAYDEFINSDDPLIANSHDDAVSAHMMRLIVRVGDTPLRDMTVDQLQDVYDVYKVVLATIRNANKSFKDNKNREISTRANQVMAEIDALGVKRGKRIAGFEWIERFGWDGLKPVYAMEHIGSSGLIEAYNNVRAGEDTWAEDVMEAREYYLEQFGKYGYDSWDFEKKRRFTSTTGKDFELTLDQIMSLYAYSKRDQAADHLKYGGIVFDPKTEVVEKTKHGIKVKYNVANATAYNISEETLADIISKLTPEQKGFVDEMQTYLSDVMGAKGNEVSLAMYDVKLFREKYYFPLKSAHQYMAKAKEQAQGDVKIKNSGFSKETKPHAKNPIVLSSFMDVWTSHVNEMSMYHAFVLPMEDFYRIYNYTTPSKDENLPTEGVNACIENAYGSGATAYIEQMLKDLNGGARADSRTGRINKMMGLFKKGAVFASLSVVVQQPSAIARAAALVDTKYFIGPKVDHKRHKALWDEVKRYAPVAIIKEMGYFDTNMGKSTQDFIMGKEYFGFSEKMKALLTDSNYRDEILSKAPALADEIAWCSIWEAVKRETRAKNPGMDVTSETFLKKAGERFTEVITKTQVYDSVLSRSALMRSKDTGMKMATAFMAEPTTSINMVADALLKGKRGDRKYARTAIGAVVASQILNSILVSFVYAGRDDDEDETYLEKYIGTLTGEILDSLNPAGYIPFIKDIVSIVRGYDVERSDMAVVSDLRNAWQSLSKDNVSVYRKVEGFAGSIAQIFGLPVKNIMRDARGIYQTVMSFVNGQHTTKAGIAYAVKGAITGQTVSDQQQLYEAIISGDKVQISRVKSRFKDQSAINTAIRKALRENDPRIKEAASAKFNGDLDEYLRIAKEIIAEKHFVQDDVVAAINAEINALSKDDTTPSAQKASGMFKTEDFALAIAQSDSALANAIKTDIIQTAQKNGKSAEEAEKNFNSGAKGELKEMFLAGALAENKAIKALVSFCGDEQEEAEERVEEWAFQKEYGFAYDDHGDAYMNGEISAHELKAILMDMGGKTEEEADLQIQAYDWEVQGFEGATVAAVRDYNEHCAAFDVPKDAYLHIRKFSSNTENDLDEATGKTIYYSAMKKVMAEIHAQTGLTAAQKDAIARSLGWSEKNIQKYKLW